MSSLRINISWTLAGNLSFSAVQWLVIILITKVLGVEQLGNYALGLALVSPLFLFTNLSMRSIQATDTQARYSFTDYFIFRCLALNVACIGCFLFTLMLDISDYQRKIIGLLALLKISESISEVYFGMFQQKESMDLIGRSMIFRSLLAIVLAAATVIWSESLEGVVISLIFAYGIVLVFYDVRKLGLKLNLGEAKFRKKLKSKFYPLLLTTLPLGVTVSVNVLYQSIPRLLLEQNHGAVELGIFAGIAYFIVVGSTVVNAVAQSSLPRLAKYAVDELGLFLSLLKRLLVIAVFIGILGVLFAFLFSDLFLVLVYSEEFLGQRKIFVILMLMAGVVYISGFLGSSLTAMQHFQCQAYISITCILLLTCLSFMFIPDSAALGAAYAMLAAYTLKVLLEGICVVYFYRRRQRGVMSLTDVQAQNHD